MLDNGTWTRAGSTLVIDLQPSASSELELEYPASQPTIRRGSRGAAVTTLQTRLQALGFDAGGVDGAFGANTEAAVRAFQSSRRLTVDGVVGPITWNALLTVAPPPPTRPPPTQPTYGRAHVDVPFYGYQTNDAAGCFRRCTEMARAVGVNIGGPDSRIQVGLGEDGTGRVRIDPAKARDGVTYIDSELGAGRPVCVGVSYMDSDYNVDALTDHFVLITTRGSDPQRGTYYAYHDPGTSDPQLGSDQNPSNRFYRAADGGLYRPPSSQKPLAGVSYDVSMVRRNT